MEISNKSDLFNEILRCGSYDEIINLVNSAREKDEKAVKEAEIAKAKTEAAKAIVNYTKLLIKDNIHFKKLFEDESFMTELNKISLQALEDMKNYLNTVKTVTINPAKNKTFSTDNLFPVDDLDDWDKAIQAFMDKNKY